MNKTSVIVALKNLPDVYKKILLFLCNIQKSKIASLIKKLYTESLKQNSCCLIHKDDKNRKIVVLPVPSGANWIYPNQIYFKSTGTSNYDQNFEGVYFPIAGISEQAFYNNPKGWYIKMESSDKTDWLVKFCEFYKDITNSDCTIYKNFLRKFQKWFHVQQSASLGGEFWKRQDLDYIRELALNYDWDGNEFLKRDTTIPEYKITDCIVYKNIIDLNNKFDELNALIGRNYHEYLFAVG